VQSTRKRSFDATRATCYRTCMSTAAHGGLREPLRTSGCQPAIGIDLQDLGTPKQRSVRLIERVLREGGSAEGLADLSNSVRSYLDQR
jgi:hypothetical protein